MIFNCSIKFSRSCLISVITGQSQRIKQGHQTIHEMGCLFSIRKILFSKRCTRVHFTTPYFFQVRFPHSVKKSSGKRNRGCHLQVLLDKINPYRWTRIWHITILKFVLSSLAWTAKRCQYCDRCLIGRLLTYCGVRSPIAKSRANPLKVHWTLFSLTCTIIESWTDILNDFLSTLLLAPLWWRTLGWTREIMGLNDVTGSVSTMNQLRLTSITGTNSVPTTTVHGILVPFTW